MKILVINAGSSSVKYGLFENKKNLTRETIERIGLRGGCSNHEVAIRLILNTLIKKKFIRSLKEIKAVGHRIVHGDKLRKTTLITSSVLKLLRSLVELAPLHQPHGIKGIEICQKLLQCKHYAIFDTTFYTTLPEKAKHYAIPWKLWKKYEIQRYGFHGTSHQYVYKKACLILKKKIKKAITCHLGNGVSITAILNGKAIDTSMGFTPLEGCIMGSRSGDVDAGIIPFLIKKEKLSAGSVYKLLNEKSGLVGICGKRDMRDVLSSKDKRSKLALEMFCYRIAKYIGAYAGVLGGVDTIIFTAGIGENSARVRKKILSYLGFLRAKVLVILTDEEQAIAEEILKNL